MLQNKQCMAQLHVQEPEKMFRQTGEVADNVNSTLIRQRVMIFDNL
jgi:hypothetical protein